MRWFAAGDRETPLDPDEARGLHIDVRTRGELDELEHANITDALRWAYARRQLAGDLLTVDGLRDLHRRMFSEVWSWAGSFRTTEKNLGVAAHEIGAEVRKACDDARFWLDEAVWPLDEAAVRLHHRLVRMHPFPNGNGRHARLTADLLLHHRGGPKLHWPAERGEYIAALRDADERRYEPLVALLVAGEQRG